MSTQTQDLSKTNEITIAGIYGEQAVTATFTKTVLKVNSKDFKTDSWRLGELEVYIKPDLLTQAGVQIGDTILIKGFVSFNFWNDKSFPKVIAMSVQLIQKNSEQPAQNFNAPQAAPVAPQVQQTTSAAPTATQQVQQTTPEIPQVPGMPGGMDVGAVFGS